MVVEFEDEEEWRAIDAAPGYFVSSWGRVYSEKTDRFISAKGSPYPVLNARVNGRTVRFYIHRLVAFYFVPGWDEGLEVNHKDGQKINNHNSNLEWCTPSDNMQHAYRTGLSSKPPPYKGKRGS